MDAAQKQERDKPQQERKDVDIDVLQVVLAGAAHADEAGEGVLWGCAAWWHGRRP